uniref:SWIM-type domain-containing protein n=1 Tax=Lactuca sativa TaxID=4236 RepID=A0A9R1W8V6_LACSA|nr:hypothetical protein LSAT_V11C300147840 [Lactuca sativa]
MSYSVSSGLRSDAGDMVPVSSGLRSDAGDMVPVSSGLRSDAGDKVPVSSGLRPDAVSSGHWSDAGDKVPVSSGLRSDAVSGPRPDAVGKAQYVLYVIVWYFRKQREELGVTASHTPQLSFYPGDGFSCLGFDVGLIPAIAHIFPCVEHKYCLRHIYKNMRKVWRTTEYKEHLWNCAKATTIPEFETLMREFRSYDVEAYEWIMKIPPHHCARSHLSDMLLNNLCEVFNSKLVKGRDKPIITCLEFIREYLMKRVCNVMKVINKCTGSLTPTGERLLQANISSASQYTARWNGVSKYQIKGPWHDQHVVDMGQMTCSCRKWELTGMPCKNAIARINEMSDNGEQVGELYTYVHKVYWLETWKSMCSFTVDPIKGRSMWPKSDCPTTLTPPPHHKQPGRPKKKRRQTADEKSVSQSQKENPQQGQCEISVRTRAIMPGHARITKRSRTQLITKYILSFVESRCIFPNSSSCMLIVLSNPEKWMDY